MFEHEIFKKHEPIEIPLHRDCQLMDVKHMAAYEQFELQFSETAEGQPPVVDVTVNAIKENTIELSWLVNMINRFHTVDVVLPLNQFFGCVECTRDNDPILFVDSDWLRDIFARHYTIFCWIDAIGVEGAIENGSLSQDKLLALRSKIDQLAADFPDILFISFADNILLKTNWTVVNIDLKGAYTYNPERLLILLHEIRLIYKCLGLRIYAVLSQGHNFYNADELLHSKKDNHICLNTLGLPFAELFDIETSAKKAIKDGVHPPCDLYMDSAFYQSLRRKYGVETPSVIYEKTKLSEAEGRYYYDSLDNVLGKLEAVHGQPSLSEPKVKK